MIDMPVLPTCSGPELCRESVVIRRRQKLSKAAILSSRARVKAFALETHAAYCVCEKVVEHVDQLGRYAKTSQQQPKCIAVY